MSTSMLSLGSPDCGSMGVSVRGGDRVVVETLVLRVGEASDTVDVRADAPLLQSTTGERII